MTPLTNGGCDTADQTIFSNIYDNSTVVQI
jgi:hypothetical protein